MVPLYVEVDDGLRLSWALERERKTDRAEIRGDVPEIPGGL